FYNSLKSGAVQDAINKSADERFNALANRKEILLGTNQYPNFSIVYILLGSLMGMWYNGWVVFLIPEIIASLVRAISSRKFSKFNMPYVSTFTYFFVCMVVPGLSANLWHPMWVVFLAIPLYYILFGPIDAVLKHKRCQNGIKVSINADAFDNEDNDDKESDD
ncbi:MAG: methylmalonyl-CoA mutase family protein, partial [Sphaerochaeta sp.]|nr:methylmalonyl-CoA mutase family protein [Sphaerochaeta sp.]